MTTTARPREMLVGSFPGPRGRLRASGMHYFGRWTFN